MKKFLKIVAVLAVLGIIGIIVLYFSLGSIVRIGMEKGATPVTDENVAGVVAAGTEKLTS